MADEDTGQDLGGHAVVAIAAGVSMVATSGTGGASAAAAAAVAVAPDRSSAPAPSAQIACGCLRLANTAPAHAVAMTRLPIWALFMCANDAACVQLRSSAPPEAGDHRVDRDHEEMKSANPIGTW